MKHRSKQTVAGQLGRLARSRLWLTGLLLLAALIAAACAPAGAPAEEAAAPTDAPAEEATAAPEEEATAEPEEEATAQPEEEAQATAEPAEEPESMGDAAAGAYIFNIARGCGCHMNRDLGALAGGNKFEGPFGVLYSRNITPHSATGIGSLSDQQIADSIRLGKRADGANLGPVMPRFAAMSDKDVMDLVAYLRSLEPVENDVPASELAIEVADFVPAAPPPAEAPTEGADRGRYIATIARCGQCHTPLNEDGTPNMELLLAGAPFRDTVAPNLTPHEDTGLGLWSEQEIADFLGSGVYNDGTEAHAGMKGVVDSGIGKLTEEDRLAIAAFLKSLPAVDNLPEPAQ